MNRRNIIIFISVMMMFILSACGSQEEEDYAETTISVAKKGRVSETIVENFSKDYYDLNELQKEFNDAIDQYNDSIGSQEIKLRNMELKDAKVYVDLEFTGPSDYERFVGEKLFVGSISDAYDNGYSMDVTLKGTDSGDKISKIQIMGMPDRDIVILSEHARIRTFHDIAYVSANVDVLGDKEARVLSESEGLAYIILK